MYLDNFSNKNVSNILNIISIHFKWVNNPPSLVTQHNQHAPTQQ